MSTTLHKFFVVALVALCVSQYLALYNLASAKQLQAEKSTPMTRPVQAPPRFGISDLTSFGTEQKMWLIHDTHHTDQCVLVIETAAGAYKSRALTSQPWPCN